MNSGLRAFIDNNRQTGSTTCLAELAIATGSYLVMHNHSARQNVLRRFSLLNPKQVVTLPELRNGHVPRDTGKQIYVDAACLCCVMD